MDTYYEKKIDRIIRNRKWAHQTMIRKGTEVYKELIKMEKKTYTDAALSKLTKELIAVGISVVNDCESCMEWHIHESLLCGAKEDQVIEAIGVGIEMGGGPATVSARFALLVLEYYRKKGLK